MKTQINQQASDGKESQSEALDKILEALESFFSSASGEVVEYMEKMLYEWYQHHAQDHHEMEKINEMVNGVFRVNDLLLKLNDAMIELKEEQGKKAGHLCSDHSDYRFAS